MIGTRITFGGSRRRSSMSRRKLIFMVSAAALLFLAFWEMPVSRRQVLRDIELPKPVEVK